jgi:hypothetical protein
MDESIFDYLQRKLREVGSAHWEALATDAKVPVSLPRKLAYERTNPGVVTIQPLYDYLRAVDAGTKRYPWDRAKKAKPDNGKRRRSTDVQPS